MDEPSAQAAAHVTNTYIHGIKEIKNLEQFYEAKVLAVGSKNVSATPSVHFGSKPVPRGPDGQRLDDESSSSDVSYVWYDRPNTPMANIPNSTANDDMKSRWVPPNSVPGNNDYPSSVIHKGGYL